jgi:cell wall-associated NlpC family hydrolase
MPARSPRRLVALIACLSVVLLPQQASTAPASRAALSGDGGSGPKAWMAPLAAATYGISWSDVPRNHWARTAIDHVGATNDWMRDYAAGADGSYPFKPDELETRRLFARSLVRAFAPNAKADTSITFADVPPEDRSYRWASVAVASGWMTTDGKGNFAPSGSVTVRDAHRALVLALGLGDLAAGADALKLRNGTPIQTPADFGTLLLGMRLGLRYNNSNEALDVGPDDSLTRAQVAWSLYRATTAPSWIRDSLSPYGTITLPNLGPRMQRVVAFAVRYVGYPYVWGGEWHATSPSGYCCGYQPRGGFDCSGLTWWLMKKAAGGWNNRPPREYAGWDLPQRTSAQMAAFATLKWKDIRPGDLLFYDGNGDRVVDHVDVYLGNGWAFDSGSSNAGVTITRVANSWYQDHFVGARRLWSK